MSYVLTNCCLFMSYVLYQFCFINVRNFYERIGGEVWGTDLIIHMSTYMITTAQAERQNPGRFCSLEKF